MNIEAQNLPLNQSFRPFNDPRWANQTAVAFRVATESGLTRIDYYISGIRAMMTVPALATMEVR